MNAPSPSIWDQLTGQQVVLDVSSPYVILGRVERQFADWLVLSEVDVHDLRDTPTTREKYILDSRLHGVHVNRRQAWVRMAEIVCVSRLADVVAD
jgi:hypothetical protein